MGAPGAELAAAIADLAAEPLESDLTFDEVRQDYIEQYGRNANAQMATDAGFPRAPKGTRAWRDRQSFLRRIQRYTATGGESRHAKPDWVKDLAKNIGSSVAPGTVSRALREIRRAGVAVVQFGAEIRVSSERRPRKRTIEYTVYLDPEGDGGDDLEAMVRAGLAGDWDTAAYHFAQSWGAAYGIGGEVTLEDVGELTLRW